LQLPANPHPTSLREATFSHKWEKEFAPPQESPTMREKVIAEARSWIGTPYHNCADIKGVGVDCGMLLVRVFVDLGLAEPFDPRPYTHDWHMHRDEERYLDLVLPRARRATTPRIGDVMLFRVGRSYSHGGLISRLDPLTIIHASLPSRVVLEEAVERNAVMAERVATALYASVVEGLQ
jgi:cell wall-associated NlpC family hydrolase